MASKTQTPNIADNAPDGVAISEAEKAQARGDGAKEAEKSSGEAIYRSLTDGAPVGDPPSNRWLGSDEIMRWEPVLDLGVDAFEDRVSAKADDAEYVPDEKVYGLLALERNGRNRTPYVKAMMSRLKLKKDDLPGGGPDYTNDVTAITSL